MITIRAEIATDHRNEEPRSGGDSQMGQDRI
jgi:hypothetical protein